MKISELSNRIRIAELVKRKRVSLTLTELRAIQRTMKELADLAEEANGDPDACPYNVPIGERIKELRGD